MNSKLHARTRNHWVCDPISVRCAEHGRATETGVTAFKGFFWGDRVTIAQKCAICEKPLNHTVKGYILWSVNYISIT